MARRLKMLGMILFWLGLVTGFALMSLKNPRMGLAAHLEGVMNGMFLVLVGFLWHELRLTATARKVLLVALLTGTFTNWLATLLAAAFGTSKMTPIAGHGFEGVAWQESLVSAGLAVVGLTMLVALSLLVYGLRGKDTAVSR